MKAKTRRQSCPECGGRMEYGQRTRTIEYRGFEDGVRVSGWWCASCGEGILSGDELRKYARALQSLKARVEGVLSPEQVTAIREKLGLSQRRAGEVLGGGPRAFQKYEAGSQTPSIPMTHLLTLLSNDPARLQEILSSERSRSTRERSEK